MFAAVEVGGNKLIDLFMKSLEGITEGQAVEELKRIGRLTETELAGEFGGLCRMTREEVAAAVEGETMTQPEEDELAKEFKSAPPAIQALAVIKVCVEFRLMSVADFATSIGVSQEVKGLLATAGFFPSSASEKDVQ